jgi:cytochrome b
VSAPLAPGKRSVRVWDLPVRLTHWALAICIVGLYATAEYGWLTMQWHFRFGYATLALVLFRIFWGLLGSEHARFGDFVRGPRAIARYLGSWGDGTWRPTLGHNPLGALAVLAMLALILAQAISGLFSNDEIEWFGPLSERISMDASAEWTDWHHLGQQILLALIVVHLLAVSAYRLIKREDLVTPMLSGRKLRDDANDAHWRSPWLALVLFLACCGGVWAIALLGPALAPW